jgi:octaprenyl-diphosphate synthase
LCALGAQSVIEDVVQVENMRKFGELIMAFQIKDDLFDYSEDAIGKPTGLRSKKMTLPLIHVLNTCTSKRKTWLINSIIKIKNAKQRS